MKPGELKHYHCPDCHACNVDPINVRHGRCAACGQQYLTTDPTRFPPIWQIHAHPLDYPSHYVIRVHWGPWGEARVQLAGTLELARIAVQMEGGSFCLGRAAGDDPHIAECWI